MSLPTRFNIPGAWPSVDRDTMVYASGDALAAVRIVATGPPMPLWVVDLSESVMFCRHVIGPDGKIVAVGKGQQTGAAILVVDGGAPVVLGSTYGNQPFALGVVDGRVRLVWMESASSLGIYDPDTRQHSSAPVPAEHVGTSQGLRDLDAAGAPLFTDDLHSTSIAGVTLWEPTQRGAVWAGQTDPPGIAVVVDGRAILALAIGPKELAENPRLSVLPPGGRILVCAYTGAGASVAVLDAPYAAYDGLPSAAVPIASAPSAPAPVPVPAPIPAPVAEPSPMPDFATSTLTDDALRATIAAELRAVNSNDDPSYWFKEIREHPTPATQPDWGYWKDRIDTGDGVGKGYAGPAPSPAPPAPPAPSVDLTKLQADLAVALDRIEQLEATRATVAALAGCVKTDAIGQFVKHGDPVKVTGSVTVFGIKSNTATWSGTL